MTHRPASGRKRLVDVVNLSQDESAASWLGSAFNRGISAVVAQLTVYFYGFMMMMIYI